MQANDKNSTVHDMCDQLYAHDLHLSEDSLSDIHFVMKEVPCSASPLYFDDSLCIGCNSCANICQCDILFPSPEKGKHPLVIYPGECYYCGACVMSCPRPGAVRLNHPLRNRAKFIPVIPAP